jgi:transcriptional regulator with XRE-family HTH domain
MTIEDLAVAAGLSVDYVNKVELGRHMPTAETLVRLADALDVPVSELFPDRDGRASAKRQALDRLRAFAAAFGASEIGYMIDVLRAIMKRHR